MNLCTHIIKMNISEKEQLKLIITKFFDFDIEIYENSCTVKYLFETITIKTSSIPVSLYEYKSMNILSDNYRILINSNFNHTHNSYYVNIKASFKSDSYWFIINLLQDLKITVTDVIMESADFKPFKLIFMYDPWNVSMRNLIAANHLVLSDGCIGWRLHEICKFDYETIESHERLQTVKYINNLLDCLTEIKANVKFFINTDCKSYIKMDVDKLIQYPNLTELHIKTAPRKYVFHYYQQEQTKENWRVVIKLLQKSSQNHLFASKVYSDLIGSFL